MSDTPRKQLERLWRDYGCLACAHYRAKTTSCKAFPERIPIEVAGGQVSHIDPLDGDHGIRFEPKAEYLRSRPGARP